MSSNDNCTTLMFTSDVLKKLRKQQQLDQMEQLQQQQQRNLQQQLPRPPGQQHRVLPPHPAMNNSLAVPTDVPDTQPGRVPSLSDSCSQLPRVPPAAAAQPSQQQLIKPAKSTPSLLAQLSSQPIQTSPGTDKWGPTAVTASSSCKNSSYESLAVTDDCYSETQDSFEHDSLDVMQLAKNVVGGSKNSTPSSSFSSPGSKASSLSSSSSSRILKHMSSGKTKSHFHKFSEESGAISRNFY